jgi:hypothetical protein
MDIGRIEAVALRTRLAAPPARVDGACAIAGMGLDGDIHADPLSPRQLLLAGTDAYAAFALPPHALRENLLVDLDTSRLASGTVLQVGDHAQLRLMFQCEACGHLDVHRPGLSLRIGTRRGMLARVLRGGDIRPGDRVRTAGRPLPAWSDDWRERIALVLDALPPASVVTYKRLAQLAGVASSYCRAFPGMIARLGPRYAGKAVPTQSDVALARWDGRGLFEHAPDVGDQYRPGRAGEEVDGVAQATSSF